MIAYIHSKGTLNCSERASYMIPPTERKTLLKKCSEHLQAQKGIKDMIWYGDIYEKSIQVS
jgi:hypothetical protein